LSSEDNVEGNSESLKEEGRFDFDFDYTPPSVKKEDKKE
jgi:hypothetical protein